MYKLIDGKLVSQSVKDRIRDEVSDLKKAGKEITLAVIIVGDDPASRVYVNNKKKACEYVGFRSLEYALPAETTQEELIALIEKLNKDPEVNGILVQLPVPEHINEERIIEAIDPDKDVDGFSRRSVGALSIGTEGFVSCTPAGVIELVKRSGVEIAGKECVVMGRSNIVGKPMAMLMLRENATVTVVHSKTRHIEDICSRADILIVAIGKPKMIDGSYVKEGATVIDVGIHRLEGKKLCGDCDYDSCAEVAGKITPVPGGVGPMTIAMLMVNTYQASLMHHGRM
jgi:methylenetetrahydrofolate dehydrogenase (NADP+)/methenyltetrahydrofolate cyclohydrolase